MGQRYRIEGDRLYVWFTRGDTWTLPFTWTAGGEAVNLAGKTFRMRGRDFQSGLEVVNFDAYITVVNAATGQFQLSVPFAITAAYTWQKVNADLEVTSSGITRDTLFKLVIFNEEDYTV